ncbi:unnamed protein product [Sphacelaria rigidula]
MKAAAAVERDAPSSPVQRAEQQQPSLRSGARSQLQQLSARLNDHLEQQRLRGHMSTMPVSLREQTPPPLSPHSPNENQEDLLMLPPPSASTLESAPSMESAPEASSSSLSFSADEDETMAMQPHTSYHGKPFQLMSLRVEEEKSPTPSSPMRISAESQSMPKVQTQQSRQSPPSQLAESPTHRVATEVHTSQVIEPRVERPVEQRVQSQVRAEQPQSGLLLPQQEATPQKQASSQDHIISPQATSSWIGSSPEEVAQPKSRVERPTTTAPKTTATTRSRPARRGPRLLPTPEQLAARRLLQLPAMQPKQAELQRRMAKQSPSDQTLQGMPTLPQRPSPPGGSHEEEKLRPANGAKATTTVGAKTGSQTEVGTRRLHGHQEPMRQIHDALLQAEQKERDPVLSETEKQGITTSTSQHVGRTGGGGVDDDVDNDPHQPVTAAVVLGTESGPAGQEMAKQHGRQGEVVPILGSATVAGGSVVGAPIGEVTTALTEGVQQGQQEQGHSFDIRRKIPRVFAGQRAEQEAREATELALAAVSEEAGAAAAAAAAAVGLTGHSADAEASASAGGVGGVSGVGDGSQGESGTSEQDKPPLEHCALITASEQEAVRAWLSEGITVKKWTSGGGGTRRRKLRLEKVSGSESAADTGDIVDNYKK